MPNDNVAFRYIGHDISIHGASLHDAVLCQCIDDARYAQRGVTIIPIKTKAA